MAQHEECSRRRRAVLVYVVGTIAATFLEAIYRLGARAAATIEHGLSSLEWLALAVVVVGFSYLEGYVALHKRFIPRVIEGAIRESRRAPDSKTTISAPLAALGLCRSSRAESTRAWTAVGGIFVAVLLVRALPDPWRGIMDAGVTAALSIGLASLLVAVTHVRAVDFATRAIE